MSTTNLSVPAATRLEGGRNAPHPQGAPDKPFKTRETFFSLPNLRGLVLSGELLLAGVSYLLATLIVRNGLRWDVSTWLAALAIVLAIRFLCLYLVGLYKSPLRHASFYDLISIAKAASLGTLLLAIVFRFAGVLSAPSSLALLVLDWSLFQFLLVGLHFSGRLYRTRLASLRSQRKRVAVVGAGDAGMSLVKELASDPGSTCQPVAILDDNPQTHGATICGVPVMGSTKSLAAIVRSQFVAEVLICIPSATQAEMSRILSACCTARVPVRTLPTLAEIVDGKVSRRDLRNLRIEDLLQREQHCSDPAEVKEIVGDRTILITGAGGSIGSELSRQIAAAGPKALLLLEKSENGLFYIHRELHEQFASLAVKPLLADVTLRKLVNEIVETERPDVIFHAAAHKHVGLLELHPLEAIRNNVLGTRNLATAALANGVKRFVNISTDKAVNPQNYMGLSKKLTELCIQELAGNGTTRFMNVRFGNVAGSTGSVLRLFWEHIQKGEPLQVTDPRATRYFMSIPEAVHLILRAAGQGTGGETFVLEMGEPINIFELAKSMSLLAGFAPGKEVPIHFVGLRDGEKVEEELWEEWEHPSPTPKKGVLRIAEQNALSEGILEKIACLEGYLANDDRAGLMDFVNHMVPAFVGDRKHAAEIETNKTVNAVSAF